MSKKFIVKTQTGKPDSLKQTVKIAFAITPTDLGGPINHFDPIVNRVTSFRANAEQTTSVEWPTSVRYYVGTSSINGRNIQDITGVAIYPGNSAELDASGNSWTAAVPHDDRDTATLTNTSGSTKSVVIYVYGAGLHLASVPSFENGSSIRIPPSWRLQAYVVRDGITDRNIVHPEDLSCPIFPVPIDCRTLPDASTWTLCQSPDGKIQLKNDEHPELGYPPEGTPSEAPEEKSPLSEILERLTLVEKSIGKIQDEVKLGQQAMFDIRDQLSSVEKFAAITKEEVAAVQRSQIAAASTFERSQTHLAVLQEAVTATQQQLSEIDKSTKGQFQDLNRRVPAVESKVDKVASSLAQSDERISALEEVSDRTKDHVVAVERAVNRTQDNVHLVQQLVIATNSQLSTIDRRPGHTALGADIASQGQPTSMEQRVGPNDGSTGNLEKSLSQVQEQLSSVKKVVRTIDRRLPGVEGRADELESSVSQTRVDLAAAQASLVTLNRRVRAIEVRLAGEEERADWSSSEGSPVTFPSQLTPDTSPP